MQIKRINLALQGGGAHGAYTWGVLDRMLDEERPSEAPKSPSRCRSFNSAT